MFHQKLGVFYFPFVEFFQFSNLSFLLSLPSDVVQSANPGDASYFWTNHMLSLLIAGRSKCQNSGRQSLTQISHFPSFSMKYKAQLYRKLLKLDDGDSTFITLFSQLLCMFEDFHNKNNSRPKQFANTPFSYNVKEF